MKYEVENVAWHGVPQTTVGVVCLHRVLAGSILGDDVAIYNHKQRKALTRIQRI